MMKSEKDNAPWRDLIRAQYQNSLTLSDGNIVLLDGPASLAEAIPPLPDFSVSIGDASSYTPTLGEVVALAHLADRSKTIGVINVPSDLHCGYSGRCGQFYGGAELRLRA
jgi:hypothetical protein